MSRHWLEKLDPQKHIDWMSSSNIGGVPATAPSDPLIEAYAYFVETCGFCFEFVSLDQLRECLTFFKTKHHGSTIEPDVTLEHYWQRWFERLTPGLLAASKREKVVKALEKALAEFEA